jgi:hypothetical protein
MQGEANKVEAELRAQQPAATNAYSFMYNQPTGGKRWQSESMPGHFYSLSDLIYYDPTMTIERITGMPQRVLSRCVWRGEEEAGSSVACY